MGEEGVKVRGRGLQRWLGDVMNPVLNVSSVQDPQVKECSSLLLLHISATCWSVNLIL